MVDSLDAQKIYDLFFDPIASIRRATQESNRRRSGTVAETVRHSILHTESPDATLHHCVIAASPHPVRAKAVAGDFYMVAYVSIPMQWLESDYDFESQLVSFIGPAGYVQKLPPALLDMEDILRDRIYVGFDWMGLDSDKQPTYTEIKDKLFDFVCGLRKAVENQA